MKSKCHVGKNHPQSRSAKRAATIKKKIDRAATSLGLVVFPSRCGGFVMLRNGRRVAYYDHPIGVELIDSPGVRHRVAGIGEALHYVAQNLCGTPSRA